MNSDATYWPNWQVGFSCLWWRASSSYCTLQNTSESTNSSDYIKSTRFPFQTLLKTPFLTQQLLVAGRMKDSKKQNYVAVFSEDTVNKFTDLPGFSIMKLNKHTLSINESMWRCAPEFFHSDHICTICNSYWSPFQTVYLEAQWKLIQWL